MDEINEIDMRQGFEEDKEKKKTKFLKYLVFILGVIVIVMILVIFQTPINNPKLVLLDNTTLTQQECKIFDNNTLIYGTGCEACEETIKILENISKVKNVTIKYMDIANQSTFDLLTKNNIIVSKIPTMIVNCHVIVGKRDSEVYSFVLS